MGQRGRPKAELVLSDDERTQLEEIVGRPKSTQRSALRARVILESASGLTNTEVAKRLGVTNSTVGKWRKRFIASGLEGLIDAPRDGAPRTVADEDVDRVIQRTLQELPRGATQWSTRTMAASTGMTRGTVHRIWRAFGLKPHISETFSLSKDPDFVEKVRDIVGLYMNPPERAIVLCVDEKSQIQALDRAQPMLPMRPGQPERRSHDYQRHGTTTLFAALVAATGEVMGECYPRHRSVEFRRFLDKIEAAMPDDVDIHIVLDNYATHKTAMIHEWLVKRPRFHLHFTPTSASWLNLVERVFSDLTTKQLQRGSYRSIRALETSITEFLDNRNENPQPFIWTKSADDILQSVKRLCLRTSGTGH